MNTANHRGFNCTNLHPSTETTRTFKFLAVSVCFNCTNLHPSTETWQFFIRRCWWRRFNCTNLHPSTETQRQTEAKSLNQQVSIVQTYILQLKPQVLRPLQTSVRRFNCTNLHPSTETNETGEFLCSEYLVSIVQTYILQLKLYAFSNSVRSVRFNCTNLHPSTETYTVNRHRTSTLAVSIVQTYILQLKHNITMFHKGLVKVSIVQTYILQLKPLQKIEIRNRVRSFNCTNLHPSTETSSQKQCRWQKKQFQLYKLTSFN